MDDSYLRWKCRLFNAFGMVRQGILQEIEIKINTFKAGMSMKTNNSLTKCPKKVGHFCITFGHFRRSDTNFAEKSGLVRAICRL
jgi:hypothetical protein